MTNPPKGMQLPLSSVENMKMEIEWMIEEMIEVTIECREELAKIKAKYGIAETQPDFDPLKTIGK